MTVLTYRSGLAMGLILATWATLASAEPRVTQAVHRGLEATPKFELGDVPTPSATDAGNAATYRVLAGEPDGNGAGTECLNDGKLPAGADEPGGNFFFAAGSEGGRLLVDLGKPIAIKQVNTYSWHPTSRGPQVYTLYAAPVDGDVNVERSARRDPASRGWKLLAEVDTRDASSGDGDAGNGGQYGVSIADDGEGDLIESRYLLFVIKRTDDADPFGHTFFSEIDVVDGGEHPPAVKPEPPKPDVLELADGYAIEFYVSEVPELKAWVDETLKPVCAEWYPKIVAMLPSDGYEAPKRFKISFRRDMQGVAHCAGTNIECAGRWFTANLDGEAAGAVVHEMVHVVQQYGRRRGNRNPGWLVEGLADYIRWFLYESEDQRPRVNPDRANYTDSYRTTGAFLDYVMREHDKTAIEKLNAAMREGEYREELWNELTGKSVEDAWAEFVETLRKPPGEEN